MTYAEAMKQAAAEYLRGVIAQCDGNAGIAAARIADCNRTHFYQLLKRHGVEFVPAPRSAAPPRNKTGRRRGAKHSISRVSA